VVGVWQVHTFGDVVVRRVFESREDEKCGARSVG
jgi:hypothetical protein